MIAQHFHLHHVAGFHPGQAIVERDPGAGDRRGAGAAVGLDDVAVDGDLALAERLEVAHRAQAAPDQPLDFDGEADLLAGPTRTPRALRPITRWISTRRRLCSPADASRRVRSKVARGSMPYSAVIQPRPWPLSHGGRRSSRVAVTSTWVSPNFTKHEPSANLTTPRSRETGRSSSGCRRLGRICALLTAWRLAPAGPLLEHHGRKGKPVLGIDMNDQGLFPGHAAR